MTDHNNWYHFPPGELEAPVHPEFDDIWCDRCAALDSCDLFEDIDVDPPGVVSALSREDNTVSALSRDCTTVFQPRDEADFTRRKRIVFLACLLFALSVGVLGTIVGVATSSPQTSSNEDISKLRGTAQLVKPSIDNPVVGEGLEPARTLPLEDLTAEDTTSSSSTAAPIASEPGLKSITTSSTGPCTTEPSTDEKYDTNKTVVSVPSDEEPEDIKEQPEKCVPSVTLRKKSLLSGIEPCIGCTSQVVTAGKVVVVKYGSGLYFHTNRDGKLERSPTVYPVAPSQDIELAISKNVTVVSDPLGGVYVIDNKEEQQVGRKFRIVGSGVSRRPGFGRSIAIDGDLMAVGTASGLANLYRFKHGSWRLETQLHPDDIEERDEDFGEQVAVRGDKVAVTGFNDDDQPAVFVYKKDLSSSRSWKFLEEIAFNDPCEDCDIVGLQVTFTDDEGSLMISYAPKNRVFYSVLRDGDYSKEQEFTLPPEYDVEQVAVSGRTMVVGGSNDMLVFTKTDNDWVEVTKIMYNREVSGNVESISFDDNNLIISSGNHAMWYTLDGCIAASE